MTTAARRPHDLKIIEAASAALCHSLQLCIAKPDLSTHEMPKCVQMCLAAGDGSCKRQMSPGCSTQHKTSIWLVHSHKIQKGEPVDDSSMSRLRFAQVKHFS